MKSFSHSEGRWISNLENRKSVLCLRLRSRTQKKGILLFVKSFSPHQLSQLFLVRRVHQHFFLHLSFRLDLPFDLDIDDFGTLEGRAFEKGAAKGYLLFALNLEGMIFSMLSGRRADPFLTFVLSILRKLDLFSHQKRWGCSDIIEFVGQGHRSVTFDGPLVEGKSIFVEEEVSWESLVADFDLLKGSDSCSGSVGG